MLNSSKRFGNILLLQHLKKVNFDGAADGSHRDTDHGKANISNDLLYTKFRYL
jgi:hypothetical protein